MHPVPVAPPSLSLPAWCPGPWSEGRRKPSPDAYLLGVFTFWVSVSSLVKWVYEYLLGGVVLRIKGEDSHGWGAVTPAELGTQEPFGPF